MRGMMTYQAMRDRYPLRAAAVYGGFTDLEGLLAHEPSLQGVAKTIWPDLESRRREIHERRTALRWAERMNAPVLIMHGGADASVPPAQALALAVRLEELKHRYELIIRAGANHVMTEWRVERDRHAIEWFTRHLAR